MRHKATKEIEINDTSERVLLREDEIAIKKFVRSVKLMLEKPVGKVNWKQ